MPARTAPGEVVFAVYRGRIVSSDGVKASFRAWVWAETPDRLHAEILPPIGGPAWILDAGGGRLSVTDIDAATCWTGPEGPRALEDWLGVPLDVAGLVGAILGAKGPSPPAVRLREPAGVEGFPARIQFAGPAFGSLLLERSGYRVAPRGNLGTAAVPRDVTVRDLSELDATAFGSSGPAEDRR